MKKGESHQRALRPQRRAPDLGGPPGLHRLVDRRPPGRGCGRGASRRWRSPPDRRRYARPRAEWECARDRELRVGEGGRRPWRVGPLGADLRVAPSVRHRVLWCRRVRVSLLSFVLSFFRHTHRSQSSALQAARPHMHAHGDTPSRDTWGCHCYRDGCAAVDSWPARASAADWGLCSPGGKTQCTHFTSTLQTSDALN
jgi:hypothetical protein